ncbi:uncharacterized protein B0H18DRAFT_1004696 [Fomitopsis serialis]|uniref:uncharacterized protein n=1 Tax=Fomitopsis serialis TaxID=139415 RepID=UPI0020081F65|nr:uncharacterized protein B0H18DRAFT_1004696 [Neoantrodia serialis]KAH9926955.1 hypothetical protein B0H18DRAFT_1004696 [Neoantrodia serialis]
MQACAAVLFIVATGAFMALRAYAISNRSLPLAFIISLSSLVIAALDMYQLCTISATVVPPPAGCVISGDLKAQIQRPLFATGQASTVIPEALLLVATWRHAYIAKTANDAQINTPYTTRILRDGIVYFVTIFILRLVNISLDATPTLLGQPSSPITYALQAILLSRFYLNLHEANSSQATLPSRASQLSDLRFAWVVGSLAGSVAYDQGSPAAEGMDVQSCSDCDTDEELVGVQEEDVELLSITAAIEESNAGSKSNAPPSPGIHSIEDVPRAASHA